MVERRRKRLGVKAASWRRLKMGAANAAEMIRLGRLTTPHRTQFDVVHQDRIYGLRRYQSIERAEGEGVQAPLLLIPPLMVTSEIYDMAPELSAVSYLLGQGVDVWLVDFGAPERIEGGMTRTLDDHVLAVSDAIDRVRAASGRDVHLGGYSQGGMFCYQAAAYRRSEGIASLITFGSPVDIHQNLPMHVSEEIAEKVIGGLRRVIERPLQELPGLPGFLTSFGFKMVSPKKEVEQLFDFVGKLHDRQALEKRESRRRFLGGEGFVAWPGPALRTFVDDFIVANRMAAGGFVIDGRTVSLADLDVPHPLLRRAHATTSPAPPRCAPSAAPPSTPSVFEVGDPGRASRPGGRLARAERDLADRDRLGALARGPGRSCRRRSPSRARARGRRGHRLRRARARRRRLLRLRHRRARRRVEARRRASATTSPRPSTRCAGSSRA